MFGWFRKKTPPAVIDAGIGHIAKPVVAKEEPMQAACKKAPDANGCVQLLPPEPRIRADGFTVDVTMLASDEIKEYCKTHSIFRGKNCAEPPPGLSFVDRALYATVISGMKDDYKAELYERGGMELLRETILEIVKRLKAKG